MYICLLHYYNTLSERTGGYPDDNLIKEKKKKRRRKKLTHGTKDPPSVDTGPYGQYTEVPAAGPGP